MCVCTSIRPGISVNCPTSITSDPAGGGLVPTDVMRSSSTITTTFWITRPDGSIIRAALIAFVAANAESAVSGDDHQADD
jgi:hypothetical protein